MKEFESRLATARKLSALANPANGGLPGEIDNARRMLAQHLEKYGLTPEMLSTQDRRRRDIECISLLRGQKPVCNLDLVRLAKQCLAFVVGENRAVYYHKADHFTPQKGPKPDKRWRIYIAEAEVTELEYEEWRACFQHYVLDFLASKEDLKQKVKLAQAACKVALEGFIHRHQIFPPSSQRAAKGLSPDELAALIAALTSARGEAWQRPAGKLDTGRLLL
jgi:hypothetical protein